MGNRRGATFLELLVAVAAFSVLITTFVSTLVVFDVRLKDQMSEVEALLDASVGELVLRKYFSGASPSWNLLIEADDSGASFFDYHNGYPIDRIAAASRTMTLEQPGDSIDVIVKHNRSKSYYVDPGNFYTMQPNADPTLAGSETFNQLGTHLLSIDSDLMQDGNIVMFYAAQTLRPTNSLPSAIPRRYAYLALRTGGAFQRVTLGGKVYRDHPIDGISVGDLDDFLRRLPENGGGATSLIVTLVKVLRFQIVQENNIKYLRMGEYDGQNFVNQQTILASISRVTIERPSIAMSTVNFDVEY